MVTFDGLSAKVRADTAGFVPKMQRAARSVEGVGDEATQTAGRLKVMESAADSATRSFAALSITSSGLGLSFGTLTTSLTGTTAALGVATVASGALLSTLAPLAAIAGTVAAGLGAVAAAFGTIIGTGILAFGEKRGKQNKEQLRQVNAKIERLEALQETEAGLTETQQERLDNLKERQDTLEEQTGIIGGLKSALGDLREQLAPIITEFGEQFVPLIEDTIAAIPALVENIFAAIGGLDQFVAVLRDLGNQAFRVIPDIVAGIFDLARVALPPLMDAIAFVSRNAGSAFEGMLRITRELAPELMALGRAFIDVLPQIVRLGTVILNRAVPALTQLISFIDDILTMGQESSGFVDFIKTGITELVTWLTGPGAKLLQQVSDTLVSKLESLLSKVDVSALIQSGIDILTDVINSLLTWFNNDGAEKIASVATSLLGTLATAVGNIDESKVKTQVVKPLLQTLGTAFDLLVEVLGSDQFQDLLEQLSKALVDTAQVLLSSLADAMIRYAQSGAFIEDLAGLGLAVAGAVRAVITGAVEGLLPKLENQPARGAQGLAARRGGGERPQTNVKTNTDVLIDLDDGRLQDLIKVEVNERIQETGRGVRQRTGRQG